MKVLFCSDSDISQSVLLKVSWAQALGQPGAVVCAFILMIQ